ncbi:PCC domain-containing protein [Methanothrix sp.]|uniref:PPC domain-containing DNA-binding protein n=1 Tax=Methanothrix sp. TaxID=90426 RepID=UPI0032968FF2
MLIREFEGGRSLLARLEHGAEIIDEITSLIIEKDIRAGHLNVIGALDQAEIGYYDQLSHSYQGIQINEPVELASCSGNISLLGGRPYAHVHAVLSGMKGTVWAGHLTSGRIFAAELYVQELAGPDLIRSLDTVTGLNLWREE